MCVLNQMKIVQLALGEQQYMKRYIPILLLISTLINPALGLPMPAYKNADFSDEVRLEDLLSRMTLAEKIGQMSQ